ncbi:MAG: hypothetical protein ABI135_05815 [Rhodoferax sp.]
MITRTALPEKFKPYQRLTVCSNLLIGGVNLVVLGEVLPLLVGSGEGPMIWLQAPTDKTGKNYVPLVQASVATHPKVKVEKNAKGLTVFVGHVSVLHVTQENPENAVVDLLDLRPVGVNIYGNSASLIAGGSTFSANTFKGSGAMLTFAGGH